MTDCALQTFPRESIDTSGKQRPSTSRFRAWERLDAAPPPPRPSFFHAGPGAEAIKRDRHDRSKVKTFPGRWRIRAVRRKAYDAKQLTHFLPEIN